MTSAAHTIRSLNAESTGRAPVEREHFLQCAVDSALKDVWGECCPTEEDVINLIEGLRKRDCFIEAIDADLDDPLQQLLQDRAASYIAGGPSSEHTARLLQRAADEIGIERSVRLNAQTALGRKATFEATANKTIIEQQGRIADLELRMKVARGEIANTLSCVAQNRPEADVLAYLQKAMDAVWPTASPMTARTCANSRESRNG